MKRFFIFLISFLILIFILGVFIWQGIYFPKDKNSTEGKFFLIGKGQGLFDIAKNLEKENLIKNRIFFNLYGILTRKTKSLQAGEYKLNPSMNIIEIAEKITSGQVFKNIITIPEGWNLRDIGEYLEEKEIAKAEEFIKFCQQRNLEGYLFPDTYEIFSEDGIKEIIEKMQINFDKKLTLELREEILSQGKTIFEIITIASLIEKEVRTIEDKKIVSGILWKRLKNGMPLQVDATIRYITGQKTTEISKKEIQIDSPYNTYKYRGLPLGPICNPGLESVLASLYPQNSGYWYYLSTLDGETIFSKTLKEHNIAKQKYLK